MPIVKKLALVLVAQGLLVAGPGPWRNRPVPSPPAWLRSEAEVACPGTKGGAFEAYFSKGGSWLVKLTDPRTATPREILFLPGVKKGTPLKLGEVFYTGDTAAVDRTKFRLSLRVP